MKKVIQNVLAQNSSNEILYLCSKCGKEVGKNDSVCNNCGARLGNIRCPFCNFVGNLNDFRFDTCPRCGRKKFTRIGHKSFNAGSKATIRLSSKLFWFIFFIFLMIIAFIFFLFLYNFELINL